MKNKDLITLRRSTGLSADKFAKSVGISVNTYRSYEFMGKKPRPEKAKKILSTLKKFGIQCDIGIFYPEIKFENAKTTDNKRVIEKICEQMNSMSPNRKYDVYEVSAIDSSRRSESLERKCKKFRINSKSIAGKKIINERIAEITNELLTTKLKDPKLKISVKDVVLFKRCKIFEYENRKNKSTWNIPNAKKFYECNDDLND